MSLQTRTFPKIIGLGGDPLMAPENSIVGYWSALGAGTDGLAIGVRMTKDGELVCSQGENLLAVCGIDALIKDMTWDDINKLDAGKTFRSTTLDSNGMPTGAYGTDLPWEGDKPDKAALRVPQLRDVLLLFGRRTTIFLLLPAGELSLTDNVIALLSELGLLDKIGLLTDKTTCVYITEKHPQAITGVIADDQTSAADQYAEAEDIGTSYLLLQWRAFDIADKKKITKKDIRSITNDGKVKLILTNENAYGIPDIDIQESKFTSSIAAVLTKAVIPTVEAFYPPATVAYDTFTGQSINRKLWAAGYSHINQDTVIEQNDGLYIRIKDGGEYSGAAAICLLPLHGRFDVQAAFHVANPQQGTTFEVAAICIDPGYHNMDNSNLNTRSVNLTFDVHGAPPYASSERDENDGFRCGWNNGFNLAMFDDKYEGASVNMYNKYGRDVGDGSKDNPEGMLRMLRNGEVFSCYYKDKYNSAWVCSGAMLVQNMGPDVFIRLAAKHWNKGGKPAPGNEILFKNFRVLQF